MYKCNAFVMCLLKRSLLVKLRTSLVCSMVSSVHSLYCIQQMHTIKEDELATYLCRKDSYVFGARTYLCPVTI